VFTNIQEVIDYIDQRHGRTDFNKVKALFAKYHNFQDQLNCIHVAGTNGKGSTVDYIAHILIDAGYKVGVYTSPHLEVMNERIMINDVMISNQEFIDLMNFFYRDIEDNNLSFFEIDTLICYYYFYQKKVNYCVIEVGLGGRLDATNVLSKPLVSVITNIGFDHMQLLGNTIEAIAGEKAGIIKDNVPVVVGCKMNPKALGVIEEVNKKHHAPLIISPTPTDIKGDTQHLTLKYEGVPYEARCIALYQSENIATALTTIKVLQDKHLINIPVEQLQRSISHTFWLGRFETMQEKPEICIDGAHNIHGVTALCETLDNLRKQGHKIYVVFAALKDKETAKMVTKLLKSCDKMAITDFDFYRCKKAEETAEGFPVKVYEDWHQAISEMLNILPANGILLITGSLYFISQVRPYLRKISPGVKSC